MEIPSTLTQDGMLLSYLLFLKEEESDEDKRNELILKAVNDYYLIKGA